jgi:hypothetical protein
MYVICDFRDAPCTIPILRENPGRFNVLARMPDRSYAAISSAHGGLQRSAQIRKASL